MTDPDVVIVRPATTGRDGYQYPEQRYAPPPIGLDPHRFTTDEFFALPIDKLELKGGLLVGSTYQQESLLVALLSNVGLRRVIGLVPQQRWLEAMAEARP